MTDLKSSTGKFKDLIAKRSLRRQAPLSGGSKALLREAVLQLIDHHQQFDLLVNETRNSSGTSLELVAAEDGKDGRLSVNCCISYLKSQAQATGIPLATLAVKTCVAKLSEVLQQRQNDNGPSIFLEPDQRSMVDSILDITCTLKSSHSFDRMQFAKEFNSKGQIPLEILWKFHSRSIMTYDLFITSNLGQPHVFSAFTTDLGHCALLCLEEANDMCARILKDTCQFLIATGYAGKIDAHDQGSAASAVQKACVLLLDSIIEKILDSPGDKGPTVIAKLLDMARDNSNLTTECLTKYFSHLLIFVLGHKANFTVKDAIGTQSQWSFGKTSRGVTDMYRQLLLAMECKEAVDIIQRVVEREEVNWRSLLTFSATLLVCCQPASQMIQDLIDSLLVQSLESCEQDGLIAAFLLARQATNEGPHVFPSYTHWFKEHFGEGSNSLGNKKTIAFFLAFLTSLVPHEPAEYLKVHVKNQPHLPLKCRESLSDYIFLAKTRLADLKVPLEAEGIYQSSSSPDIKKATKTQMQDQATEDVDKAVAAFDRTAKIPTNIFEASIFKRPYFIGRFLPALLKPRLLPDIPDSKMKFIEELKCSDKIPATMLQQYEKACAMEASSLLEGAFTDDAFDDCLEPMDALSVSLDKLPAVVAKNAQAIAAQGVTQQISIISDRLGTVLDNIQLITQHGLESDCIILDLDKTTQDIHPQHMEVVDMLLGSFCKSCLAAKSPESHTGSTNALWANQFVAMLSKHQTIHGALYHRLWSLTRDQCHSLSRPHIYGIAVFLVQLQINQHLFTPLFITGVEQQADGSLLNHISRCMKHHTKAWMKFSLRFATDTISFALHSSNKSEDKADDITLIPLQMMKMLCYLLPRLCSDFRLGQTEGCQASSELRLGQTEGCQASSELRLSQMEGCQASSELIQSAVTLYHSQAFQAVLSMVPKLTLKEWIDLELEVDPYCDELNDIERKDYYRWMIVSHYLHIPNQDGGCQGSYQQACTWIMEAVLDHDVTSAVQKRKQGSFCHGDEESGDGRRRSGCRTEIIQLLQELIPFLSPTTSNDETPSPWLLSIIERKLQEVTDDEMGHREIYMICFIRLVYTLPGYFLFSNKPEGIPRDECVQCVQQFISQHMRVCQQDGAYGLTLVSTSYMFRALLHIYIITGGSTASCVFIEEFLQLCPLVTISFLIYWSKLWPTIMASCSPNPAPKPLSDLNLTYQWAQSLLTRQDNSFYPLIEGSIQSTDPWLLGVAMATVMMRNGSGNEEDKMVQVVELLSTKTDLPHGVPKFAVECLIAYISWDMIKHNRDKNFESLSTIWKIPGVLEAFDDDTVLKQTVLRPCITKIYPVAFFRFLLSSRSTESKALSISKEYLHTVLRMHARLVELHCQLRPGYDDKDAHSLPLSLDFHLACTRFTHDYLNKCPLKLLQSLTHTDISTCDEDIRMLIAKRLRNV